MPTDPDQLARDRERLAEPRARWNPPFLGRTQSQRMQWRRIGKEIGEITSDIMEWLGISIGEDMSHQKTGPIVLLSTLCGFAGGIISGLLVVYVTTSLATGTAPNPGKAYVPVGAPSIPAGTVQQNGNQVGKTMTDMRTIGIVCESIRVDSDQYPDVDSLEELADLAEPLYVKKLPFEDAWGRRFLILTRKTGYQIRSIGADGAPYTSDDIVNSNGSFVKQGP